MSKIKAEHIEKKSDEFTQKNEQIVSENLRLKKEREELAEECSKLRQSLPPLESELVVGRLKMSKLVQEVEALQAKVSESSKKLSQYETRLGSSGESGPTENALREELRRKDSEIGQLRVAMEEREGRMRELANDIEMISGRLREAENKHMEQSRHNVSENFMSEMSYTSPVPLSIVSQSQGLGGTQEVQSKAIKAKEDEIGRLKKLNEELRKDKEEKSATVQRIMKMMQEQEGAFDEKLRRRDEEEEQRLQETNQMMEELQAEKEEELARLKKTLQGELEERIALIRKDYKLEVERSSEQNRELHEQFDAAKDKWAKLERELREESESQSEAVKSLEHLLSKAKEEQVGECLKQDSLQRELEQAEQERIIQQGSTEKLKSLESQVHQATVAQSHNRGNCGRRRRRWRVWRASTSGWWRSRTGTGRRTGGTGLWPIACTTAPSRATGSTGVSSGHVDGLAVFVKFAKSVYIPLLFNYSATVEDELNKESSFEDIEAYCNRIRKLPEVVTRVDYVLDMSSLSLKYRKILEYERSDTGTTVWWRSAGWRASRRRRWTRAPTETSYPSCSLSQSSRCRSNRSSVS